MRMLILAAGVLSGCVAVSPVPITGPNGQPGYSMQCSGFGRTWDSCYKAAGEKCPNGYRIVQQSSDMVAMPVNGSIMMAPKTGLVVECR